MSSSAALRVLARTGLLGLLALACTGIVSGRKSGDEPGKPGSSLGSDPQTAPIDPGFKEMHRLNMAEYNATVADVLGTSLQPATTNWRNGEIAGFDNIASVLGIDDAQYERYLDAAEALADDVFSKPELKSKIVTCASADDDACITSIISNVGLRIFRRPVTDAEIATYRKVYDDARQLGDSHDDSAKLVLTALLSSAEFLYRIELDPNPAAKEPHAVSPYELASRLSYFLWSSAPDDALLEAAKDGSLASDAGLAAAVDRMLADPKSDRFIENFAGQWLGARTVDDHAANTQVFPLWTPAVAESATKEMHSYFAEFLRSDRSWLEFLKADINFVDANLAPLYGVQAPGNGMQRIELKNDDRFGFFGLAGFLALSSMSTRTSPTLRGRWILINILCTHPADPPPDIPMLEESAADASQKNIREVLAVHRKNPACASCHAHLDPYGIALEEFDGIGRFRSSYPDGSPVDASTDLPESDAYPEGISFTGLQGLADAVTQNPHFSECVAEKLFTYGLGRVVTDTDHPYLDRIREQWLGGPEPPTLRSLIRSLIMADTFRLRRPAGAN